MLNQKNRQKAMGDQKTSQGPFNYVCLKSDEINNHKGVSYFYGISNKNGMPKFSKIKEAFIKNTNSYCLRYNAVTKSGKQSSTLSYFNSTHKIFLSKEACVKQYEIDIKNAIEEINLKYSNSKNGYIKLLNELNNGN